MKSSYRQGIRSAKKTTFAALFVAAVSMLSAGADDRLAEGFASPPDSAKPRVYWHWMNGHVTKEGVTADLEAMKEAGIGGTILTSVYCGRLAHGPVPFGSPEWDDCVRHAMKESERLGLEVTMNHCSGMSDAGGPWVAPSNSMFRLCCGETRVRGGETFKGKLPRITPDAPDGFFHDWYRGIATLAFPLPQAEAEAPAKYEVRKESANRIVSAGGATFTLRGVAFTVKYSGGSPWYRRLNAKVDVSDDGKSWREAASFDTMISDGGTKQYQERPVFAAFSGPATGKYVRIRPDFGEGGKAEFARFRPMSRLGLGNIEERFLAVRDASVRSQPLKPDVRGPDAACCIAPESIVDLTAQTGADGSLEWTAPAGGEWVVLRIGYYSLGTMVGAPPQSGKGLEVDKLDADAVRRHFEAYAGKFADEKAMTGIENDSWEKGSQNWTHGFEKKFEARFGYSIVPYLVALSGRTLESPARTDAALLDFRRFVSDTFCENFAAMLTRLAHEHGMETAMEPCGNSPANTLDFADAADLPMCEFWVGNDDSITYPFYPYTGCFTDWQHHLDAKGMASVVHLKGTKFLDAEAFTALNNFGGKWLKDPFGMKAMGDLFYTLGVNRCIYHRWAHQPWTGKNPGMTMGRWGTHFERTETWWPLVKDWLAYQARCQFLLSEGHPANDVLIFAGDAVPDNGRPEAVPTGMSWDVCGPRQLRRLTVKDSLIMPNGYKALIVPENRPVSRESEEKIESLRKAGARIVRVGGYYGVAPDFICADKDVRFIRRHMDDGRDFYFVASSNTNATRAVCSFRQKGRFVQLWDAESGRRTRARDWRRDGDRTEVVLDFKPCGSCFIVFADGNDESLPVEEPSVQYAARTIPGAWEVEFPVGWYTNGTDTAVKRLDRLVSWTVLGESDFKYFSGIATYRKTIDIPKGAERVRLDLGEVKNVAEVTVDGKRFPVLWRPPFRVEITDAVRGKTSAEVSIRVANLWPNRLIGDAREPKTPHTYTTWEHWTAKDSLLPSGILGPARLEVYPAPAGTNCCVSPDGDDAAKPKVRNLLENGDFDAGSFTSDGVHAYSSARTMKDVLNPHWTVTGGYDWGLDPASGVWVAKSFAVGRWALYVQTNQRHGCHTATIQQDVEIPEPGDYGVAFRYTTRPGANRGGAPFKVNIIKDASTMTLKTVESGRHWTADGFACASCRIDRPGTATLQFLIEGGSADLANAFDDVWFFKIPSGMHLSGDADSRALLPPLPDGRNSVRVPLTIEGAASASSFTISGDWELDVSCGGQSAKFSIEPPRRVAIEDERYAALPVFAPTKAPWARGERLKGVVACECSVRFALDSKSVKVRSAADGLELAKGTDWVVDEQWGAVGWKDATRAKMFSSVLVSYAYAMRRTDSVVRRADGSLALLRGRDHVVTPRPPALAPGDTLLGNVTVDAATARLELRNVFPVMERPFGTKSTAPSAEKLLPRTWTKLNNGERVTILAWGDSVTDGFFLPKEDKWQEQFVRRLHRRFPKAEIRLVSNGWSGKTSSRFLAVPPESPYHFESKVAGVKADLVISEFVNDCGQGEAIVRDYYPKYLKAFRDAGSEWVAMTPHYVHSMGQNSCRGTDDDPRPFVKALRAFAAKNGIALADASRRWGHLWREGIPFSTMFVNDINHPVAEGMTLFADALMELFGADAP